MAECNSCGGCCDPVSMPFSQQQLREVGPRAMTSIEDYLFVLNDLTRIPYREGLRKSPHYKQGGVTTVGYGLDGEVLMMHSVFYECRHFDKDTRRCTNYENRPPLCRDYPWYGDPPDPSKALPLDCSYIEDIPVHLRPRPRPQETP